MDNLQPILNILSASIRDALRRTDLTHLDEIRLRAGQPPSCLLEGGEQTLALPPVTTRELEQLVSIASGFSAYAAADKLREGFLTLPGGHRVGVCGTAANRNREVAAQRDISSVCIRVARQVRAAPEGLVGWLTASTVILGAPGWGKTTLLRDCVRLLSDSGQRVSLADERNEVAAVYQGVPQLEVGRCTDVLTGCGKSEAMMQLLRTMDPQWIAADEITAQRDIDAMEQCSYCGVKLLATAHAASREELARRPLYRRLLDLGLFEKLLILDSRRNVHMERMMG